MYWTCSLQIKCAVYLIGGWADCYHTAIFRMAENFSCDWRALIGPWPHEFPDDCIPGPRIGYLQECLRFWDYHLKGVENGINKEPRFRVYLQESKTTSLCRVFYKFVNNNQLPGFWPVDISTNIVDIQVCWANFLKNVNQMAIWDTLNGRFALIEVNQLIGCFCSIYFGWNKIWHH